MNNISILSLLEGHNFIKSETIHPKVKISLYKAEPSVDINFYDYLYGLKFAAIIDKLRPHYDTIYRSESYTDILTEEEQQFLNEFWKSDNCYVTESLLYISKFSTTVYIGANSYVMYTFPKELTYQYLNSLIVTD